MTFDDALDMAADAADDPDELLEFVDALRQLRWSNGAPVVRGDR